MKILLTIHLGLSVFLSFAQQPVTKKSNIHTIEIQTSAVCEMCKYRLEKDLTFEKGVKEANLNLDDKVMSIVYNAKKTNVETLRRRISKIGYHADSIARDSTAYQDLPMCCKDGFH